MTTDSVEQLVYLLDQAFEGDRWHSLLGNLGSVAAEDWSWVPDGGDRSVREIVEHAGACKLMYENHAFGDGTLGWDDPLVTGAGAIESPTSALDWLRDGQRRLRQSVAALDDGELTRPRRTNWGEMKETRWIIGVMIAHDFYHAGEINHLRSLRSRDDRWAFARES